MAGYNFSLDAAQRIVAAVKKSEQEARNLTGTPNPSRAPTGSFWAMLTGCDLTGTFWDWVAVVPDPGMLGAANSMGQGSMATSAMWQFADPHIAGFANAREINNYLGAQPGNVVQLAFLGYGQAQTNADGSIASGTITSATGQPGDTVGADNTSAYYVFSYGQPQTFNAVPLHDHRDNLNGGFAFSCYHPGTSLPQVPFAV